MSKKQQRVLRWKTLPRKEIEATPTNRLRMFKGAVLEQLFEVEYEARTMVKPCDNKRFSYHSTETTTEKEWRRVPSVY